MLHLRCTYTGTIPLEAECITPDRLAGLSLAGIAALPVQHGNATARLADFFTIDVDPSDADLNLGPVAGRGLAGGGGRWGGFAGAGGLGGAFSLLGPVGERPGAGLKGAPLVPFAGPPPLMPTFHYDCRYRPAFLDLCLRH